MTDSHSNLGDMSQLAEVRQLQREGAQGQYMPLTLVLGASQNSFSGGPEFQAAPDSFRGGLAAGIHTAKPFAKQ